MGHDAARTWPPPFFGRPGAILAAVMMLPVALVATTTAGRILALVLAAWLGLAAWRWGQARYVYYGGLLLLMTAVVALVPWALFASWVIALHAFALFEPRAAFAWLAVGGLLGACVEERSVVPPPAAIGLLAPLVVAGWYLSRESEERRRLNLALTALQGRLVDEARVSGVREERNRMAREIHDTIAQDLSASVALLEAAAADGVRDERVLQSRDLARAGLAEARRSVLALGPGSLAGSSLAGALRHLVDGWTARTGVDGAFESDPDARPLDDETEAALFRIAQSALANVAEHARATRVRVTLSYLDDEVVLDIRDDGVGFEPREPGDSERGFGLPGMRKRVADLGGTLNIETDAGTSLRAAVPIR